MPIRNMEVVSYKASDGAKFWMIIAHSGGETYLIDTLRSADEAYQILERISDAAIEGKSYSDPEGIPTVLSRRWMN